MKKKLEPLTEDFLLKRGFCCGCACLNCPFDYEAVPEPQRQKVIKKREDRKIIKKD